MTQQKIKKESQGPEKKKISLALQGGGSHGAFAWGVLDAILEDGRIEVEGLSGTSAGAMNALAFAQGVMQGGNEGGRKFMHHYWKTMCDSAKNSPFKPHPIDASKGSYSLSNAPGYKLINFLCGMYSPYELNPYNINPLKKVVDEVFDFKLINKGDGPKVFLCATHVTTGKIRIFHTHELSSEAVLASACLPTLFHAVEVEGEYYWDGGFIGNPAIFPLIDHCETPDIVVIQIRQAHRPKLPTTAREIEDRHKEITFNASLVREMRTIAMITDLIDKGIIAPGKMKRLHMHHIQNEKEFSKHEMSSALNSTWEFVSHLFEVGRETGKEWIEKNYDSIGVKSTADIKTEFVTEQ